MGKIYEALYENGHLEWLGEPPGTGRHRLLVTVISTSPPRHTLQEVRRMLEATRGAWGHGKTLEEIDMEIDRACVPSMTGVRRRPQPLAIFTT